MPPRAPPAILKPIAGPPTSSGPADHREDRRVTGSTPDDGRPPEPTDGGVPPLDANLPEAAPPDAAPPPDAPTQRTGIISAAPVGWSGSDQPAAPPADQPVVAWAPPVAGPAAVSTAVGEGLVIAGTFSRLVAYVIDGLLLFTVTFAIGYAAGSYRSDTTPELAFAVAIASLVIDGLYFIVLWRSGWHATIGMRLIGIRILGAVNGATLGLDSAIIRWLALAGIVQAAVLIPVASSLIGLIAFVWLVALLVTTAMDRLHQGIHDRWAGSVVVQRAPGGSGAAIVGCLVLVALVVIVPFVIALLVSDTLREILSRVGQSI
jgi:uncharacterized RDD family membrane protein YckC